GCWNRCPATRAEPHRPRVPPAPRQTAGSAAPARPSPAASTAGGAARPARRRAIRHARRRQRRPEWPALPRRLRRLVWVGRTRRDQASIQPNQCARPPQKRAGKCRPLADPGQAGSNRRDVFGLQALLTVDHLEAHLLPFLQALEARTSDGAEMDEHVGAAFTADEAEPLGVVEPLDCIRFTIRHDSHSDPIQTLWTNRPQRADGLLSMPRSGATDGFRKSPVGTHVAEQTQRPKHNGFLKEKSFVKPSVTTIIKGRETR